MTTSSKKVPLFMLTLSMVIFGTVGIFRRMIPLPSSFIALVRGAVGALILIAALFLGKHKKKNIKKQLPLLILSGVMIGFNWILLFESYNYTTVATATLCYYMAPVFIILFSPLVLKEKLTARKGLCAGIALVGMVLLSGVLKGNFSLQELRGVLLGLGAAILYAAVILSNKKITGVPALTKTAMQLLSAAVVLLPYTLLTENVSSFTFSTQTVLLLLVMGIVHTGIAYVMYFGSIIRLSAQTSAIFSYIDPIVAILLSAFLLGESMGVTDVIGTVFILGAAFLSELPEKKHT